MKSQKSFVNWFRDSSPYIHAHRSKTFVISFGSEAVLADDFDHHVHDFALLSSLGIRLVLVHGIRLQIDQRLNKRNAPAPERVGASAPSPTFCAMPITGYAHFGGYGQSFGFALGFRYNEQLGLCYCFFLKEKRISKQLLSPTITTLRLPL